MTFSFDRTTHSEPTERSLSTPRSALEQAARRIRQRIQIQIPPKYAQEPIVSTLATRYELDVNILSALLASNSSESGWFDLELNGIPHRIQAALKYLEQLHIEILSDDTATQKSWTFQ
ncbi:NIL domain-containing protein [Altericista sp. CCNU0014]|uniref:NIL domain-containing protein n=1 Tax=Altericista sp. CCNU0014 TaxID=3082949 RepID=UPI00384E2BF2